ncbi:AMP-binding protein [Ilumatobacter nonamiensis]|uniref:AMP-binding protein n=1 Tax=Ilumatobacter nonamiensis TaxID=467093 RepID=UPI0003461921|nr:AMP-binding protein [Ilumatobacter nonamiensis]
MPAFAKQRAAEDPTGFALVDAQREYTWSDVDEALNRCANRLRDADARGELGTHHRIAVFAENAAETALAHLGGLLAGTSSVPVNFHLTASEAAYILSDSESGIVFVGPETVERGLAAAAEAGVGTVIGWGCDDIDGVTGWNEWLAAGSTDDPPSSIIPLPNLLYTSGTTGLPKGTELPPTMFAGGVDMVEHLERLAQGGFAGFGTHLVVGPMYHTGPLSGMRLLCAGVSSVILDKFDAEATLAAIDRYRTESAVMVPTHFVRMLALSDEVKAKYDVSSMKLIAHTGAKCPIDVKAGMIEWFGPVFRDAYGATEVGTVCSITSEEWMDHRGSVGRSIPPFHAVVLDDRLNELPAGTEGQLYFRDDTGRGIVYPNDSDKTAASNPEPGLFTLGEIGYMDDDGYVYITDRFNDMVVSGGVNIYPAESELLLIDHPGVADVACVGVPHPDMGEKLVGLVIPTDAAAPPDVDEISTWLRERLSTYKCPREYHLVTDLGRTTMGKVNKRRLRDSWLAGELTGVSG